MNKHSQDGFNMVELLVTLVIAAILITIAAPAMKAYLVNQKLTSQSNALVRHLSLARSEAITRNTPQGIILTSKNAGAVKGNWSKGWVTWENILTPPGDTSNANIYSSIDEDKDRLVREADEVIDIEIYARDTNDSEVDSVTYRSDGMLGNPPSAVDFYICHVGAERPGRHIRVRLTGRVSLQDDEYTGAPCP